MRIGILTFHAARNYGAILQCYALQEFLNHEGHQVYVIDYKNDIIMRPYALLDFRRMICRNPLKMILNQLRYYTPRKGRQKKFDKFITDNIRLAPPSPDVLSDLDLILVGSDQVWNFELTGGFDRYYWGNFEHGSKTRLASFAASMMDNWDEKYSDTIRQSLQNFEHLSVRESSTARKLSLLTDRKVEVCVDPTLLLSCNQWGRLAEEKHSPAAQPYLLLYQVAINEQNKLLAEQVAKDLNLTVRYLSAREDGVNSNDLLQTSPSEFVALFKNASFVVSSSFHGTVFSLIFNKPFISIRSGKNRDARVETLLNYFELGHHFIRKYDKELLHTYLEDYNADLDKVNNNSKEYLRLITNDGHAS